MKKLIIALLFLPLSLPVSAFGVGTSDGLKSGPLSVVTENFPPYNYENAGEALGLSSEVIKAMLKEAKLSADITFHPWPRAYRKAQLEANTVIYSIARIPERENQFIWIGEIAPYRTSLFKLKSNDRVQISNFNDARAYPIGVSQDDVINTYLENRGFNYLEVAHTGQLLVRMLLNKRIPVIAYDEAALPYQMREAGYEMDLVEPILRIEDLSKQLYVAMHPNSDPDLVQRLRDALFTIKQNGVYQQILSRYFPSP